MWWRRRRRDEDFHREIDAHIALETDRLITEGMAPAEARIVARRAVDVGVSVRRSRGRSAEHCRSGARAGGRRRCLGSLARGPNVHDRPVGVAGCDIARAASALHEVTKVTKLFLEREVFVPFVVS